MATKYFSTATRNLLATKQGFIWEVEHLQIFVQKNYSPPNFFLAYKKDDNYPKWPNPVDHRMDGNKPQDIPIQPQKAVKTHTFLSLCIISKFFWGIGICTPGLLAGCTTYNMQPDFQFPPLFTPRANILYEFYLNNRKTCFVKCQLVDRRSKTLVCKPTVGVAKLSHTPCPTWILDTDHPILKWRE